MIRKMFVDDVEHETDLGRVRRGLRWTQSNLLWTRIEGQSEAVLEQWGGIGPLTGGVQYLHLPSDGLFNVGRVASALASGAPSPPSSLLDRLLGAVHWLWGPGALLVAVLVFPWIPESMPRWGLAPMAGLFFVVFGQNLMWLVLRTVLSTSMAAELTRSVFGRPGSELDAGTYEGPVKNRQLAKLVLSARLSVLPTYGRRRWLVLTRTGVTPVSARTQIFGLEESQMPALLDALKAKPV